MNVLEDLIYPSIDELNDSLKAARRVEKRPEASLYGSGSSLDSLGLVTLLAAVEERIETQLDVSVTIASERAMSRKHSPFRTLASLADYVEELLREQKAG